MSKKCFLICPIGESGSETRKRSDKLMTYLIEPVCNKYAYNVFRSDIENTTNKIDDDIFNHLDNDDLSIADLTDHNPNVFYEAGYRNAKRLPLIQIAENGTVLPFDVGRIRTYFYDFDIKNAEEFKGLLSKSIESILNSPLSQQNQLPSFAKNMLRIMFSLYVKKLNNGIACEFAALLGTVEEIASSFFLMDEYTYLVVDFLRCQQYIKFENNTLIKLTDKAIEYCNNNFNILFQDQIQILCIIRNLCNSYSGHPITQGILSNFVNYSTNDIEILKCLNYLICSTDINGTFNFAPSIHAYNFLASNNL